MENAGASNWKPYGNSVGMRVGRTIVGGHLHPLRVFTGKVCYWIASFFGFDVFYTVLLWSCCDWFRLYLMVNRGGIAGVA